MCCLVISLTTPIRSKLKCILIVLSFCRFPIPDFRPPHDMQRVPWWKRHVRPDYLVLKLTDATWHTSYHTGQKSQKYVLQCGSADVSYVEADTTMLLPIAKLGNDRSSLQDGFNCPR